MTGLVSRRRSFLQYLADNNPFYLLSAASMLCACLLLSNTTTWSPIALHKLLGLIGTLSLYELMLVGLGLLLIGRRSHPRDGVMILILEAFFLADVGFLASEAYQESLTAGLLVSSALMALAILKIGAIFRVLRLPLRSPVFGLTLLTMATLLFHPAFFKQLSDGRGGQLPLIVMYVGWWGVGLLLATYGVMLRFLPRVLFGGTVPRVRRAGIGYVLLGVMLASLIAHLGTAHWVYKCTFVASDASPLMAGLAVFVASLPAASPQRRRSALSACVMLSLASIVTAGDAQAALAFKLLGMTVTPLTLALSASYLTLIYAFAIGYLIPLATAGAIAIVVYRLSPSWETVRTRSSDLMTWIVQFVDSFIPYTREAWGGVTLFGAFALLGFGAYLSLNHGRRREQEPVMDLPPTIEGG